MLGHFKHLVNICFSKHIRISIVTDPHRIHFLCVPVPTRPYPLSNLRSVDTGGQLLPHPHPCSPTYNVPQSDGLLPEGHGAPHPVGGDTLLIVLVAHVTACLLYTSDAADE